MLQYMECQDVSKALFFASYQFDAFEWVQGNYDEDPYLLRISHNLFELNYHFSSYQSQLNQSLYLVLKDLKCQI